ncbi:MAG: hypothetical protein COT33_01485 [Candidatus Nealsonbacteria bacterium CG08_land_8_20_14_0_20_38_20]|uniref:DNA polymerase III subunit delta n=1 Tax=Candidatus Nealsonbacteria bacterium CG08_land_8_20_14_0_20_38_20 TaxID=1974705 RepID=A0A2H0YM02_9BACT|nr:MAG: hypothetical protein COT33_01485 [Candidatus Nealsonbacteria bacterium CG08_land_8_20_14_0_20_38_20]
MLIGHQKQWGILKKLAETGKLSHAYLFSGPEKLGKKKIALELLSLLFGKELGEAVHPDFVFIGPTEGEIKISQIRGLSWRLSLKNLSAPFKGAIIDNAHLMNFQAQTCLLKTLEEPRGKAILILVTQYPQSLLPTIISRCQTIKFYPAAGSEIENYLISKGLSEEKAKEIAEISLGRPGLAIDFLLKPEKIEEYRKAVSGIVKIANSNLAIRFQYAKKISENPAGSRFTGEILEIWLWYLRKILLSKIQGKEDANFKNFPISKLRNILQFGQRINFLAITQNINQRLALENLMLEL